MEANQEHNPNSVHSQEVEMNDENMRQIKIKSIDGNTYEISVSKDVRY